MDIYNFLDGGEGKKDRCDDSGNEFVQPGEKDTYVQLVISLALGSTAFFAFCVSQLHVMSRSWSWPDEFVIVTYFSSYLYILAKIACALRYSVRDGKACTPPDDASSAPA